LSVVRGRESRITDNGPRTTNNEQLSPGRIWNPDAILELSDRASIYADPRTMAKDTNKGLRVPMDVWYGKYWGRIQGNNKERRHNHHNQIPEVYLERVIKACSNPGGLVLDPFCGSGTTSTVARALGRRSITIEYSKVNAASAWERITNVGVIKREDADKPQSTAIFGNRRKREVAKA
jgi:DNA modification methylase